MNARQMNYNGSKWIRPEKRLAIYIRDNFHCVYCGKDLRNVKAKLRTLDHVVAVAHGGVNTQHNLVTCCKRCNESKGNKTLREWEIYRKNPLMRERVWAAIMTPLPLTLAKAILAGEI